MEAGVEDFAFSLAHACGIREGGVWEGGVLIRIELRHPLLRSAGNSFPLSRRGARLLTLSLPLPSSSVSRILWFKFFGFGVLVLANFAPPSGEKSQKIIHRHLFRRMKVNLVIRHVACSATR